MTDFLSSDTELSAWAKALAHPARLAILRTLGARGPCVCGEVVEVIGLAQSTVSQHLKVLREAGLVRGTPDGARSCYCLELETLQTAVGQLAALVGELTPCDDGCC